MKIQLLISAQDQDYCQHLSQMLAQEQADTFEVSICFTREKLPGILAGHRYDVGLFDAAMLEQCDVDKVTLPLVLWDEGVKLEDEQDGVGVVRKYQRVSHLAGEIMERYAKVSGSNRLPDSGWTRVCAVWSPAGGTGKTTVALAYAARRVAEGKKVVYLDLESFSSTSTYFSQDGKSISEAFEKLGGNLELMLRSMRQKDTGSGIHYFCGPSNYDDIHILTYENMEELIVAAGQGMDEVVLDLSSVCDERCRKLLSMVDRVLLVTDGSQRSGAKLQQFTSQSNLFEQIKEKTTLVCNMGAQATLPVEHTVRLDYVRSDNPTSVYKSLSAQDFYA